MSAVAEPQDAQLVDTVKKLEMVVGRLRKRQKRHTQPSSSSTGASHSWNDPTLSLVEKARILKSRASRLARRVQIDKSDATASTSESLTRSADIISPGGSGVKWYKDTLDFSDYGEI